MLVFWYFGLLVCMTPTFIIFFLEFWNVDHMLTPESHFSIFETLVCEIQVGPNIYFGILNIWTTSSKISKFAWWDFAWPPIAIQFSFFDVLNRLTPREQTTFVFFCHQGQNCPLVIWHFDPWAKHFWLFGNFDAPTNTSHFLFWKLEFLIPEKNRLTTAGNQGERSRRVVKVWLQEPAG